MEGFIFGMLGQCPYEHVFFGNRTGGNRYYGDCDDAYLSKSAVALGNICQVSFMCNAKFSIFIDLCVMDSGSAGVIIRALRIGAYG